MYRHPVRASDAKARAEGACHRQFAHGYRSSLSPSTHPSVRNHLPSLLIAYTMRARGRPGLAPPRIRVDTCPIMVRHTATRVAQRPHCETACDGGACLPSRRQPAARPPRRGARRRVKTIGVNEINTNCLPLRRAACSPQRLPRGLPKTLREVSEVAPIGGNRTRAGLVHTYE